MNKRETELEFDIKRSLVLSRYIRHWGQPEERTISRKDGSAFPVELYKFRDDATGIYRFATIGVSSQERVSNSNASWELLLLLPNNLGDAEPADVSNYVLDIMAYSLQSNVEFEIGGTIPESKLAPSTWSTKAILLDEPRGEAEELEEFKVGSQEFGLIWLVPITGRERECIINEGLDAFDLAERASEFSIIDVSRESFC